MNWYKFAVNLNVEIVSRDANEKIKALSGITANVTWETMQEGFHLNTLISRMLHPWAFWANTEENLIKFKRDPKKVAYFYPEWIELIRKVVSSVPIEERRDANTGKPLDVLAPARKAFGASAADAWSNSSFSILFSNLERAKKLVLDVFGKENTSLITPYLNFIEVTKDIAPENYHEILDEKIRKYHQEESGRATTYDEDMEEFMEEQYGENSPYLMGNIIRQTVYPYPIDWIENTGAGKDGSFAMKIQINDAEVRQVYNVFVIREYDSFNVKIKGQINKDNQVQNIDETEYGNNLSELGRKVGFVIRNLQEQLLGRVQKDIPQFRIT